MSQQEGSSQLLSSDLWMRCARSVVRTQAQAAGNATSLKGIIPILSRTFVPSRLSDFVDKILLVDKPLQWTSFDVCAKLRWQFKPLGIKKVGHAGTLDPLATGTQLSPLAGWRHAHVGLWPGLLLIFVGKATKSVEQYVGMSKEYSGTVRLGEGTTTYDQESEVTTRLPWEHITGTQNGRDSLAP
jgi:tRNA U55 pseudouridine synthase TruB